MRNISQAYIVRREKSTDFGLDHTAMQRPEYDRQRVGTYLGLGAGFAATTLAFAVFGAFLDGKFGTSPLFALLGGLIGGTAGFYSLYRRAVAIERGEDEEEPSGDDRQDQGENIPNNS